MKKYSVGVWEEQSGYVIITAPNKASARKKAEAMLDNEGVGKRVRVTHRDTFIVEEPEEVKE